MKLLITAGPTREKIDPVRFISNRSSGKMGYAIAEAAREAGYETTLISGPVTIEEPEGCRFIEVESAAEMTEAVKKEAPENDMIIMAAAVADYRPVDISEHKIKKTEDCLTIKLERTEDILSQLGKNKKKGQIIVGFAAETQELEKNAISKLENKNLDFIIANDVSRKDRGFGSEKNAVTIFSASGEKIDLPLMSKIELAKEILFIIEKITKQK